MSSTNRGSERNPRDFYPTPLSAFRGVLPLLDKTLKHWEPAQGDGRLVESMQKFGINAFGTDINDPTPVNFLGCENTDADVIITNPPFSLALEFCKVAKKLARQEVWMLLPLNFLGTETRRLWFMDNAPDALFVITPRPSFSETGGTDSNEYAWFYWGHRWGGINHL